MKFFKVSYIRGGKRDHIVIQADSRIDASNRFKIMNLGVFVSLAEVSKPFSFKIDGIKKKYENIKMQKRINLVEYISSLRHIAVMLNAGLPITIALQDVLSMSKDEQLKQIFRVCLQDVENGIGISQSLARFQKQVGVISVSMLDMGERTGTLVQSMFSLCDILDEIDKNRTRLKKATRYPLITIFAMLIAFLVVILLVIPKFKKIFESYGSELPFPTLFLLWIEKTASDYGVFIIGFSVVVAIVSAISYSRSFGFQLFMDKYFLKIYIVGNIFKMAMIGRFMFVFKQLIAAGIPVLDATNTSMGIVENHYLKHMLKEIPKSVEEGKGLTSGFKDSGIFENITIQMINAGESGGSLDSMLNNVSDYYKERYTDLVDNVAGMIEPVLIAAIAGFVTLLALGIFLPMWSISQAVGG